MDFMYVCTASSNKNIAKNIKQVSPSSKTKYLKSKYSKVIFLINLNFKVQLLLAWQFILSTLIMLSIYNFYLHKFYLLYRLMNKITTWHLVLNQKINWRRCVVLPSWWNSNMIDEMSKIYNKCKIEYTINSTWYVRY